MNRQRKINGKVYNLVLAKSTDYTAWAKNIGIVETGLKVELPTKQGIKSYDGVKLANGKTAVYVKGGNVLKYAWNWGRNKMTMSYEMFKARNGRIGKFRHFKMKLVCSDDFKHRRINNRTFHIVKGTLQGINGVR